MKKLLLLFIFWQINLYGQNQTAHWFFGTHAGLDFSGGSPVIESGGMTDTEEGISSISNACGELQFYTDGIHLFNANHTIMPSGNDLLGSDSSTQSAIIIPAVSQNNFFYVFTVDDAYSAPSLDGINYTVVDMSLDNGLGNVIPGQKNISLINHASEKVAAVMTSDHTAVWVVFLAPGTTGTSAPYYTNGNNMNTFYAFKITDSGIGTTATVTQFPNINIMNGVGYMKISPDGTKLAIANPNDYSAYLFDFDSTTGVVSNPVQLNLNAGNNRPYGLEFSPDSSKLYLSDWNDRLTQIDLSNNNQMTIISTATNYRAALQLGLDGKIYRPYTTSYGSVEHELSVIEQPNEAGNACNYQHRSINLGSNMYVHQGLPNFISSYFDYQNFSQIIHNQQYTEFEITTFDAFDSVDWNFDDGTTLTTYPDNSPYNNHTTAQHTYVSTGSYHISAIVHYSAGCDKQMSLNIDTANNNEDTVINKINFYPNPTDDFITLNLNGIKNLRIEIMDLSGKSVFNKFIEKSGTCKIDVSGLSGIYFLKISNGKTKKTFKLVVK